MSFLNVRGVLEPIRFSGVFGVQQCLIIQHLTGDSKKETFQSHWILESLMMMLGIHGTGKYHCVSLDYIHGSKRVKNVSRNMWMLPSTTFFYPLLRRRRIHTMASIQCVLELKPRLIPSLSNLSLEYTVRLPSVLCSRMYLLCKGFLILVSQSYFYGQ